MTENKRLRIHPAATERARALRQAQTPMEAWLWAHLKNRACGGVKFRRQEALTLHTADFYCAEARPIVEVDGNSHNATVQHDQDRDAHFAGKGIHTLRFTNTEVRDHLEGVLVTIEQACKGRMVPPSGNSLSSDVTM